jgi:prepilin-type N-terminal cleavage/methylation domain-containing protein
LQHNKVAARRFGESGMTLAEVVVAMAIAGLAIAGIINGYTFSTNSAQKAAMALAANARALERIEETRSAKWDLSAYPAIDQLVPTNFPTRTVTLDKAGVGNVVTTATVITEITQISSTPPLKRIRVSCIWRYKGSPAMTNVIETCRAPDQ